MLSLAPWCCLWVLYCRVQCSGVLWIYYLLQAHGFSMHCWLLPLENFGELFRWLFAVSPSTHTGTDSHIYLPVLWGLRPYCCPWPRPHPLFVSQESCSLFSAVTAERWGTHSYLPLCYHQQLISTARMSEPPSDPAMLTATASTGGLLVSTKLLFASLCFSFSPSSVTSWLLLRKWAPSFCPVSR